MNKPFSIHIPISKVDEEQRVVWGIATTEAVDSQGDIVDYEASKAAFSSWLGNIREMHQPIAVGKAIDIQFDDDAKQVMIGAKISESIDGENAWIKVKEGILNGFSIGGNVNKVTKEVSKKDGVDVPVTRIVDYDLSETSLVDNPANPEAMFVMVKSQQGGLQRVEHEATEKEMHKSFRLPAWHMQFMPPIEKAQALYTNNMKKGKQTDMKKGMWDASFLLDLAIDLGYYIQNEEYEGEDVSDLNSALVTIKQAVVKELTEATPELTTAVELAQKITSLKKGKAVNKSVTGGEDRDENGKVVTTAEENGRPVNDTPERAAEAGVPVAGSEVEVDVLDEDGKPTGEKETKVQAPVLADGTEVAVTAPAEAPKAEEPKKVEVKTEEEAAPVVEAEKPAGTEAPAEGKTTEPTADAPAEADKAVTVGDLKKFTEGLLNKLGDNSKTELTKVLGEFSDKVEKSITSLEGRLSKLEDQPAAPKARASYVDIEKGKEGGAVSEDADVQALIKRRDELAADPNLGTPAERMELAQQLRKAQANGAVIA